MKKQFVRCLSFLLAALLLQSTAFAADDSVHVYQGARQYFLRPLDDYSRTRKYPPEYIMLHFTSAVLEHRADPFNLDYIRAIFVEYGISIHYIIARDGTVYCYVPENRVARHAGAGSFADNPKYTNAMNQYCIGIEMAAIGSGSDMADYLKPAEYQALDDSLKGFTQAQYDALKLLIEDLCSRYDIPLDRSHVIGHEEYSPGKNDPGELFDWSKILP